MKLDHAQTILNRINRMFTDVAEGGGSASALERDLLKEYVRRLYESLNEQEDVTNQATPQEVKVEEPKKVIPPVAEIRRPKSARKPAPVQAPTPAPAPDPVVPEPVAKVTPPKPKVIEIPASVEADIQEMETQAAFSTASSRVASSASALKAQPVAQPVAEQVVEHSPFEPAQANLPPAIKAIFVGDKSNDLSAKLAGSPVKDLNRAMAINERLLAQNDLFGGNKEELDAALTHLNSLNSYESATTYLGGGAAKKYDWAEGERVATARAFAKLVRRRYA